MSISGTRSLPGGGYVKGWDMGPSRVGWGRYSFPGHGDWWGVGTHPHTDI